MLVEERNSIINVFRHSDNKLLLRWIKDRITKCNYTSENLRQNGNELYNRKVHNKSMHEDIWKFYCFSILSAENGSEKLALGYGNRSALLMHLSKYKEALEDIDRAIGITKMNDFKFKLLCRKIKCLMYIDATGAKKVLQEAKSCYKNVNDKKGFANAMKDAEKFVTNRQKTINVKNDKTDSPQLEKKTDDFSSVNCETNINFEMHLTAARDIQPGEVIFVEKPYACIVEFQKTCVFCSYCHIICWNMIPCDTCTWFMYCSETCKQKSWEQYHEIECPSFINLMKDGIPEKLIYVILLVIRFIIKECRKAGSIANFRDLVLSFEEKRKGSCCVLTDKNFKNKNFENILLLDSNIDVFISIELTKISLLILINLAKSTKFFGRILNNYECSNLSSNEDMLFIGALILKLLKVTFKQNIKNIWISNHDTAKRYCISTVCGLINHDCDPNVSRCFTDDNRLVLYALKPIKKNDQLFLSYLENFAKIEKNSRQNYLCFTCNCKACREDWQPLIFKAQVLSNISLIDSQGFTKYLFKTPIEIDLFNRHKTEIKEILESEQRFLLKNNLQWSEKMLMDIVESVKEMATKKIAHPSTISCLMTEILSMVFKKLYARGLQMPACPSK